MADIKVLDVKLLIDEVLEKLPPLEQQEQAVTLIKAMMEKGVPEEHALKLIFEGSSVSH